MSQELSFGGCVPRENCLAKVTDVWLQRHIWHQQPTRLAQEISEVGRAVWHWHLIWTEYETGSLRNGQTCRANIEMLNTTFAVCRVLSLQVWTACPEVLESLKQAPFHFEGSGALHCSSFLHSSLHWGQSILSLDISSARTSDTVPAFWQKPFRWHCASELCDAADNGCGFLWKYTGSSCVHWTGIDVRWLKSLLRTLISAERHTIRMCSLYHATHQPEYWN